MTPAIRPGRSSATEFDAPLREPTITAWTEAILASDLAPIEDTFAEHGAWGPVIRWQPDAANLPHAQLAFLLKHWRALAGGRAMPLSTQIDPIDLRPALGYVSILDVIDSGRDFRFRIHGTHSAAVAGFDMTSHLLSEARTSLHAAHYIFATYRAVVSRREPLLAEHGPAKAIATKSWHRLLLPLGDAAGSVSRVLCGLVPVGKDGRPITGVAGDQANWTSLARTVKR